MGRNVVHTLWRHELGHVLPLVLSDSVQIPLARVYRMFLILDDSCLCSLQRIFVVFFVMHCPDSLDIYATEILARKHA